MKRHKSTHPAQLYKNSGISNITPTHIMLLSRDSTAFIPAISGDDDDGDDGLMLNVLRCHLTY